MGPRQQGETMTADTPTAQDADVATGPHRAAILGLALLVAAATVLAAQALPGPAHAEQPAGPSASQADGACPDGTPSAGFPDVAGNTHERTIDCVSWYGIARGTLPGAYSPAQSVRRDQMASFAARLLPAPTLTDAVPLHVRGVGRALVGMTLAEVEQLTGTPVAIAEFETFDRFCYYADPQGVSGYSFMVVAPGGQPPADPRQGIVARVSSTLFAEPHTPTTAGVRPGDPRAAVTAAYGDHQVVQRPHLYQPEGVYLDIVAADGAHGLRFEVNGHNVVEAIHAGDADVVTWPEGCA